MQLNFAQERVMAVVAHPDDAEYLCVGTLARAKADGATIAVLIIGQGDKGQPSPPIPRLGAVRRREMSAAVRLLGAEAFFGKVPDGHLADTPAQRRILLEAYRRFKPTLVLAHNPNDYHADHRAASALAEAASWFCASLGHKTPSPALKTQPALWWMDTMNMVGCEPGLYIDITPYVDLKRQMLLCHRSQLQRGQQGDFSPLEEQMVRLCQARGAQAGVTAAEVFRPHLVWKRARAW
jgi:LmbE family N-acetylglucosaminyl deacetylase